MLSQKKTITIHGKCMGSIEKYTRNCARKCAEESVISMKKIFKTLVILIAVFCAASTPTFACAKKASDIVTGSACSIAEINNLEKAKHSQVNDNFKMKNEKNLRPVRLSPEIPKTTGDDCIFGNCLYKSVLGK